MRILSLTRVVVAGGLVVATVACGGGANERAEAAAAPKTPPGSMLFDPATWTAPPISEAPSDSLGASIRRGLALMLHTRDSLPRFDPGSLNCTSCHLDEGRRATAAPLAGVFARFPKYMDRTGAVIPVEDRVNYCFTRSLGGTRIPVDSREMQDIVAYIAFISRGVPVGAHVKYEGMPVMPKGITGDTTRGKTVFAANCVRCHGPDGQGAALVPALWGPRSFSVGASMARVERAATFVRHNMPFDTPGKLSDQEAFDVAAYIVSKARPDSPGKQDDWPLGGAPDDVPYATKGHAAYNPPPVIPRRNPAGTIVPAPTPVASRAR